MQHKLLALRAVKTEAVPTPASRLDLSMQICIYIYRYLKVFHFMLNSWHIYIYTYIYTHQQLICKVAKEITDVAVSDADTIPADPWLSANFNPERLWGSK